MIAKNVSLKNVRIKCVLNVYFERWGDIYIYEFEFGSQLCSSFEACAFFLKGLYWVIGAIFDNIRNFQCYVKGQVGNGKSIKGSICKWKIVNNAWC